MQWGMSSPHSKQVEPRKDSSPKSSAFLGVSWHRSTRKWHAYITVDSQQHSLGYYVDEEEAARVHDAGARMVRLIFMVPVEPLLELSCIKTCAQFPLEHGISIQPSWLLAQDRSCPGFSFCQHTQCVQVCAQVHGQKALVNFRLLPQELEWDGEHKMQTNPTLVCESPWLSLVHLEAVCMGCTHCQWSIIDH